MRAIGICFRAVLAAAVCVLLSVMALQWARQERIEPERFAQDARVLLGTVQGFFSKLAALSRDAAAQPGRGSPATGIGAPADTSSAPELALPKVAPPMAGPETKPENRTAVSDPMEPDFAALLRKARENRELLGKGVVR